MQNLPQAISTAEAPAAIGPYSQAVRAGGMLYLSGQLGVDPATGDMPQGVEAQAGQALRNVAAILRAAGAAPENAVKTTVYLADMGDFAKVNAIYARFFKAPYPARSCVQVAALPKGALVEIEVLCAPSVEKGNAIMKNRAWPRRAMLALALSMLLLVSVLPVPRALAEANPGVRLLFTHDMHSHLDGGQGGGFARMSTLVQRQSADGVPTLLLDAGDFSMGTLYQTVYESHAAELTMMARLGYDATTLGNHEFDYRAEGLCGMLKAAKANAAADGLALPALLCANIDWAKSVSEDALALRAAMADYGAKAYTLIARGGVKVGVFGVMGADSQACAPLAPVAFLPVADAAREAVSALKAQGAELIVCLSHGGTWSDPAASEDEKLALAVPEIDVIVSGHTHSTLAQPLRHGDTLIVSCGEYTENLGELTLTRRADGRWEQAGYALHALSAAVNEDAGVLDALQGYKTVIGQEYLSKFGYTYDQTLCVNPFDFGTDGDIQSAATTAAFGDLMADAMIAAVKAAEGEAYAPVAMAVVPTGVVRGTLAPGRVTAPDAFNILSLGIGPDRVPGYPLVSVYLTGRELYDLAEVDASVKRLMGGVKLFVAGGGWAYHDNRLILSRVSEVWVYDESGRKQPVQADQLYRVVADLYSWQMLGAVKKSSFGLLSLVPKDASGAPIADFEQHIIRRPDGAELKAWAAFADYLASFGGADGTGEIDARYAAASGRITL